MHPSRIETWSRGLQRLAGRPELPYLSPGTVGATTWAWDGGALTQLTFACGCTTGWRPSTSVLEQRDPCRTHYRADACDCPICAASRARKRGQAFLAAKIEEARVDFGSEKLPLWSMNIEERLVTRAQIAPTREPMPGYVTVVGSFETEMKQVQTREQCPTCWHALAIHNKDGVCSCGCMMGPLPGYRQRRKAPVAVAGKRFVLTGGLVGMTRVEAEARITACGGQVQSAVRQNTDYVVAGASPGAKYDDAVRLGIRIITEAEFASGLLQARGGNPSPWVMVSSISPFTNTNFTVVGSVMSVSVVPGYATSVGLAPKKKVVRPPNPRARFLE